MKTIEQHFIDWESHVFGYGYGSGEEHTIPLIKAFLECCKTDKNGIYDYRELEATIGAPQTWLMINALCHANIIEYGSSPRFGFLSNHGSSLKKFTDAQDPFDLVSYVTEVDEDYIRCMPSYCNCDGVVDREAGCANPFWEQRRWK